MIQDILIYVTIILVSFALSLKLTERFHDVLRRHALLDHPNERSSHIVPTPRGGGWAIVLVTFPALVLTALYQQSLNQYGGLIGGAAIVIIVSWLDDRYTVPAGLRLFLHLFAAAVGTLSLAPTDMIFGDILPLWLDRLFIIIGWGWFINLYNFMDGIDGLTASETVALATGIGLLSSVAWINDPFISVLTLVLTGSCLGFLALNWSPAKIFMGDVGSIPLGYLIGFMLITLAVKGLFVSAIILPLYYLADSGITIVRRACRGEKIWLPHRQHFYQRSALGLQSHPTVVAAVIVANLGLIFAAILAVGSPFKGLSLAVLLVAILLIWMHKTGLVKEPPRHASDQS